MTAASRALQSGRFELRREAGRGGLGIVYEAWDHEAQAEVAIKTLRKSAPEERYWLKSEFRSLADTQHPNLVQLGELFYDEGACYFTMELVRGATFETYVRNDERRLRSALRQLAEAVAALHGAGLTHRDLKPSNVLVDGAGRVVVLDFGFAGTLRSNLADNQAGVVVGTAAFMAPEQSLGEHESEAADWYALGVMLFQALTDRLPFEGHPLRVLEEKRQQEAPRPSELAGPCPEDLEALCVALLARDPAARPSGAEVLARVGGRLEAASVRTRTRAATFVGREAELSGLDRAAASATAGHFAALLLEGEPGVGKTELVERFLATRTSSRDWVVLRGRCYEQELIPFKGIDPLVDCLADRLLELDDTLLLDVLPARMVALSALFPSLYRVPSVARLLPPPSLQELLPEQVDAGLDELAELLRSLAVHRRLVLFLDDLQWAGADTLLALERIFGGPDAPAVLLLATRRNTSLWDHEVANDAPARGQRPASWFQRLSLAKLSPAEAETLVRQVWSREEQRGNEQDFGRLVAESGGHPLFLLELARCAGQQHAGHGPSLRLDRVLCDRIERLPLQAKKLLEASVIAGVPLPAWTLGSMAGLTRADAIAATRLLRAEHLVRSTGPIAQAVIEPFHDRIREAITSGVSSGEYVLTTGDTLAAVHVQLGRRLRELGESHELAVAPSVIANQLNRGVAAIEELTERKLAAEMNLLALKQARLGASLELARHYLEQARSHVAVLDGEEARPLRRVLDLEEMQLAHLAKDVARIGSLFARLVAESRNETELADAYEAKIMLDTARGEHAEAVEGARVALARLGIGLPVQASTARVLLNLIRLGWQMRGHSVEALMTLPAARDVRSPAALRVLMATMPSAFHVRPQLFSWMAIRMALLSLRDGYTELSAYGFTVYAMVLSAVFRRYRRANELARLACSLNERFPSDRVAASISWVNALFTWPYGLPLAEALERLRHGQVLARRGGDALSLRARSHGALGDAWLELCAGRSLATVRETSALAVGVSEQLAYVEQAKGIHWLVLVAGALEGRSADPHSLDDAEATESARMQRDERLGWHRSSLMHCIGRALLSYHLSDTATALRYSQRSALFGKVQRGNVLLAVGCMYWALSACGEYERAGWSERLLLRVQIRKNLAQLATWANSCPQNFRARELLAQGEYARITGRRKRAREQLEQALAEAKAEQVVEVECLAWERLAAWHAQYSTPQDVEASLRGAIEASVRWGAHAKVRLLEAGLASGGALVGSRGC